VGSPETRQFLYGVLDELADLFPGPYIHLGGDEVKTDHWRSCPDCQRVKEELGMAGFSELNTWIMNDLGKFLRGKGKTPIVWNEALGPTLDKSTLVMHWTPHPFSFSKTRRALKTGYKVILQPFWESYFDYAHSLIPLKRVYRAKTLDKIPPSAMKNVIGVQGALWTEFVEDEQRIQWNAFPRLAAKAEVGWSQSGDRNYKDFQMRWINLQPHLGQIGLSNPASLEASNPSFYRRNKALAHDVLRDMHAEQKRWRQDRV
jgi:hexosaminidase